MIRGRGVLGTGVLALGLITAWGAPALTAQDLCEELLSEEGPSRAASMAVQGQAGVGWNFGPGSSFDELGGGPVVQLSLYWDRLYAVERCDEEGGIDLRPVPHGLRASFALVEAFWSDYTAASVGLAYLRTGPALKWWAGPVLSGQGVNTDNVGVGVGVVAGLGLFSWVAATATPTWVVDGRGAFDDEFLLTIQLSISRTFRDEHFGS